MKTIGLKLGGCFRRGSQHEQYLEVRLMGVSKEPRVSAMSGRNQGQGAGVRPEMTAEELGFCSKGQRPRGN